MLLNTTLGCVNISTEEFGMVWEMHKDKYNKKVAQKCMKEKHKTLPKNIGCGEFKDEIAIMINLLSRITSQADAMKFQPWMFYVIPHIMKKT